MNQPTTPRRDSVNKIFGEVLPETAPDDREPGTPDEVAEHERWLQDNIPPHHD